jgi:hypothetical protein
MPPASTDSSIEEQRFSSNDTNGGGDGTSSTNTIHSDSRDGTLPPSHQQEEEEEEEEENDKHRMEEDVLEEEMSHILEETWDFFKELFSHSAFENVLSEEQLAGSHLILLLDPIFDSLPMESLPCFHGADSISRDFSIYMLYYRLLALKAHPFKKEEIHYIVDPLHEDFGSVHPLQNHHQSSHVLSNKDKDNTTVSSILYQYTKKNGGPFTSWKEIVPDQAIYPIQPGPNEWQQGLLSCSKGGGFVYVGPNRVLSNIPPENIAGMNLTGCHLILTLGRCENYKSSRRQSKKDSEKTRVDLDREESIVLNALLSLCGVQTIVCNQWTTTFSANRRLVNGLFTNLAKGYSIGKALKKYGEQATPMEQSTTSSINNNNSTKKNQSTTKYLPLQLKNRIRYNPVVYGLAHLSLKQTKNA